MSHKTLLFANFLLYFSRFPYVIMSTIWQSVKMLSKLKVVTCCSKCSATRAVKVGWKSLRKLEIVKRVRSSQHEIFLPRSTHLCVSINKEEVYWNILCYDDVINFNTFPEDARESVISFTVFLHSCSGFSRHVLVDLNKVYCGTSLNNFKKQ